MTEINDWIINVAKLKGLGFENANNNGCSVQLDSMIATIRQEDNGNWRLWFEYDIPKKDKFIVPKSFDDIRDVKGIIEGLKIRTSH